MLKVCELIYMYMNVRAIVYLSIVLLNQLEEEIHRYQIVLQRNRSVQQNHKEVVVKTYIGFQCVGMNQVDPKWRENKLIIINHLTAFQTIDQSSRN